MVIVEGILVLHVPELRDQLNMKVYVDTGGFEEGATHGANGALGTGGSRRMCCTCLWGDVLVTTIPCGGEAANVVLWAVNDGALDT